MTSTAQTWIRAELIAVGDTTFGPQLMIPADGLEFHGTDLVFHCQGEVVYVAEAGQLRSVTWTGKQAGPEAGLRKSQWPKRGVRWTDEERNELRDRLLAGEAWTAIAKAHGRSRTGVQQEALKQGWVSADTYQVKEGLAEPAHAVGAPDGDAVPQDTLTQPAANGGLPTGTASAVGSPATSGHAPLPDTTDPGQRRRINTITSTRAELHHSDLEPAPERGTLGTVTTEPDAAADTDPGLDPPLPRLYTAIPAPRPRPELTAGPWSET